MSDASTETEKVEAFVADVGEGSTAWALRAICLHYGIALYYYDRECFEAQLDRPLTEDEWGRLKPQLQDFDEWLSNSGADESLSYWRHMVLEAAGIGEEE